MLKQLQACYPKYHKDQSDPFQGIKSGELNCFGATIAACAMSSDCVPLRYTLSKSKVVPKSHERIVGSPLFLALDPANQTVLSSITTGGEGSNTIEEMDIAQFTYIKDKFAYPNQMLRILLQIAQNPAEIPFYEEEVETEGNPVMRIVRIEPEKALQRISSEGNLRDLRCQINSATSHLFPQPA